MARLLHFLLLITMSIASEGVDSLMDKETLIKINDEYEKRWNGEFLCKKKAQLHLKASDAKIDGAFQLNEFGFLTVPESAGYNAPGEATFTFYVKHPGKYSVIATVLAGSSSDDSFYFKTSLDNTEWIWHTGINPTVVDRHVRYLDAHQGPNLPNPEPIVCEDVAGCDLEDKAILIEIPAKKTFSIILRPRESGTYIGALRLQGCLKA